MKKTGKKDGAGNDMLTAEQKALRVYKTYGKQQLQDTAWTDFTGFDGEAKKPYNFFKVTVEMK